MAAPAQVAGFFLAVGAQLRPSRGGAQCRNGMAEPSAKLNL
jgi:hypothetical protein